jgi:hypothetical protein
VFDTGHRASGQQPIRAPIWRANSSNGWLSLLAAGGTVAVAVPVAGAVAVVPAAAFPSDRLAPAVSPNAAPMSTANTKAAHQAQRLQWRREGGRNCRFNIPGSYCADPNLPLIAIRRAESTSTNPGLEIVAGSSELLGLCRWKATTGGAEE